jgi:hypothetical protein
MITTDEGKREVSGQLYRDGLLGVHRPYSYLAGKLRDACRAADPPLFAGRLVPGYVVTHIPTGFAVQHFGTLGEAKAFVRAIAAMNWNFTDPNQVSFWLKKQVERAYDQVMTQSAATRNRASEVAR